MKDFFHEQFKPFVETFLTGFVAAYRERYSCNYLLMQLMVNWKRPFNEIFHIGTVLMDLSKSFDCIPHDLLANSYMLMAQVRKQLRIYSYFKRRGRRVKIESK